MLHSAPYSHITIPSHPMTLPPMTSVQWQQQQHANNSNGNVAGNGVAAGKQSNGSMAQRHSPFSDASSSTSSSSYGPSSSSARLQPPQPKPPLKRLKPMASLRQAEKERDTGTKPLAKRAKISRTRHACTHCQHLKMRCSGPTEEGRCERCRRTGRECLVEERAPHRPWTKRKDLQIQQLTTRLEEMENLLKKTHNGVDDSDSAEQGSIATLQQQLSLSPKQHDESVNAPANAPSVASSAGSHSSSADVAYVQAHRHLLPFVRSDKINAHEAVELFHIFMQSCALHTVIFDPDWHTVAHVCDASPFLFGTVVYIASTYYDARRTLRLELEEEMDMLIGKTIASGSKSIEVVQAFLSLYQWNRPSPDPSEDRAWVLAGVAIRVAMELQLYKPQHRFADAARRTETDLERINRERCWMMTFTVDRSLSLAVGRPWTISENAKLVRDSARWCEQKAARPWDLGISALAELLKLASRQSDLFHAVFSNQSGGAAGDKDSDDIGDDAFGSKINSTGGDGDLDCDTMMRIMNAELEHWRRQWFARGFFTSPIDRKEANSVADAAAIAAPDSSPSSSAAAVDALDIHTRTLHYITKQASLRYHFAVLVLNSFGLQYCVQRPALMQARTSCITRAIQAAQSMVKAARDGLGATMTYSPQTQYTIFGFGLISLIKLAALVDDVVAARLVQSVDSSIAFLEQVAVASDHTPARLASLLRAMLRRRDERRGMPGPMPPPPQRALTQLQSNATADPEDDEDGAGEAAFAPGLKSYKLPHRSSRAVTPTAERDVNWSGAENGHDANVAAPAAAAVAAAAPNAPSIAMPFGLQSQLPIYPGGAAPPPPPAGYAATHDHLISVHHHLMGGTGDGDLAHFDEANAAAESMLQSLGMFGSIDTSGWTQMTVDEILDESFWLRLSDDHGASSAPPSDLSSLQTFM